MACKVSLLNLAHCSEVVQIFIAIAMPRNFSRSRLQTSAEHIVNTPSVAKLTILDHTAQYIFRNDACVKEASEKIIHD